MTDGYSPPEIVLTDREFTYTPLCDIWSMGLVMAEIKIGHKLFDNPEKHVHLTMIKMEKILGEIDNQTTPIENLGYNYENYKATRDVFASAEDKNVIQGVTAYIRDMMYLLGKYQDIQRTISDIEKKIQRGQLRDEQKKELEKRLSKEKKKIRLFWVLFSKQEQGGNNDQLSQKQYKVINHLDTLINQPLFIRMTDLDDKHLPKAPQQVVAFATDLRIKHDENRINEIRNDILRQERQNAHQMGLDNVQADVYAQQKADAAAVAQRQQREQQRPLTVQQIVSDMIYISKDYWWKALPIVIEQLIRKDYENIKQNLINEMKRDNKNNKIDLNKESFEDGLNSGLIPNLNFNPSAEQIVKYTCLQAFQAYQGQLNPQYDVIPISQTVNLFGDWILNRFQEFAGSMLEDEIMVENMRKERNQGRMKKDNQMDDINQQLSIVDVIDSFAEAVQVVQLSLIANTRHRSSAEQILQLPIFDTPHEPDMKIHFPSNLIPGSFASLNVPSAPSSVFKQTFPSPGTSSLFPTTQQYSPQSTPKQLQMNLIQPSMPIFSGKLPIQSSLQPPSLLNAEIYPLRVEHCRSINEVITNSRFKGFFNYLDTSNSRQTIHDLAKIAKMDYEWRHEQVKQFQGTRRTNDQQVIQDAENKAREKAIDTIERANKAINMETVTEEKEKQLREQQRINEENIKKAKAVAKLGVNIDEPEALEPHRKSIGDSSEKSSSAQKKKK
ncbi:MAG: hypothetical protein EZS28_002178 [Streblomastix strix]|uniref:Protein kinase domain-containing protein n=1 Tax=Streblomastix strix TaxID=222440 RepID=A0A5J4X4Y4_9EUKA|nr:MAG: hypothetical protein EZS28_002178 [Streblomastix strix]